MWVKNFIEKNPRTLLWNLKKWNSWLKIRRVLVPLGIGDIFAQKNVSLGQGLATFRLPNWRVPAHRLSTAMVQAYVLPISSRRQWSKPIYYLLGGNGSIPTAPKISMNRICFIFVYCISVTFKISCIILVIWVVLLT